MYKIFMVTIGSCQVTTITHRCSAYSLHTVCIIRWIMLSLSWTISTIRRVSDTEQGRRSLTLSLDIMPLFCNPLTDWLTYWLRGWWNDNWERTGVFYEYFLSILLSAVTGVIPNHQQNSSNMDLLAVTVLCKDNTSGPFNCLKKTFCVQKKIWNQSPFIIHGAISGVLTSSVFLSLTQHIKYQHPAR